MCLAPPSFPPNMERQGMPLYQEGGPLGTQQQMPARDPCNPNAPLPLHAPKLERYHSPEASALANPAPLQLRAPKLEGLSYSRELTLSSEISPCNSQYGHPGLPHFLPREGTFSALSPLSCKREGERQGGRGPLEDAPGSPASSQHSLGSLGGSRLKSSATDRHRFGPDNFVWEKYSHKSLASLDIKRFYYSCVERNRLGCTARKVVDRRASAARGDYSTDVVTIEGAHCHWPPPRRHQGRKRRRSSAMMQAIRNAAAAAVAATGAPSDSFAATAAAPESESEASEAEVSCPRSNKRQKSRIGQAVTAVTAGRAAAASGCSEGASGAAHSQSGAAYSCGGASGCRGEQQEEEQYDSDALLEELYWSPDRNTHGSGLLVSTAAAPPLQSSLSDESLDLASFDLSGLEKLGSQDLSELLGLLSPRGVTAQPSAAVNDPLAALDSGLAASDKQAAEPGPEGGAERPASLPQAMLGDAPAGKTATVQPTEQFTGRGEAAGTCAELVEEEIGLAQLSLPGVPASLTCCGRGQASPSPSPTLSPSPSPEEDVSSGGAAGRRLEEAIRRASSAADTLSKCSEVMGKGMGIRELLSSCLGPLVLDVLDAISLLLGADQAEQVLMRAMECPPGLSCERQDSCARSPV